MPFERCLSIHARLRPEVLRVQGLSVQNHSAAPARPTPRQLASLDRFDVLRW